MLVVETVARIRRELFVKGKSIKEIVRNLGVSRNTLRKVLRSARRRSRMSGRLSRCRSWGSGRGIWSGCWRERTQGAARAAGYRGGYDAVCRYARACSRIGQRRRRRRTLR